MKKLILCAANRYFVTKPCGTVEHLVIPDNGHFCRNMQDIIRLLKELGCELKPDTSDGDRGQGFLDESGNYHSRSEAYIIAKESGQPFNDSYTLPDNKLDSSCIRHFDSDVSLRDYM
ncbi:hypothetical protein VP14_037 [Vibrio phage VPMCC14]|nr:hypothetical protein VP14_037 [Vibrio phage VPMCC14]